MGALDHGGERPSIPHQACAPPVSAGGEGFLCLDGQGLCTFANPAAARMLGYEPGELLDAHVHRLVHHSREGGTPYPEEECPVRRTLRAGEECRVADEVFWRKDGGPLRVEYSSHPIVQEGEVRGAVVAFADVDGSPRGAERWGEEGCRVLVEAASDAVVVVGEDRRISLANTAAERLFGYPVAEMVGETLEMIVPEGAVAGHEVSSEAAPSGEGENGEGSGRRRPGAVTGRRKDGREVPLEAYWLGFSVGGASFVGIFREVAGSGRVAEVGARHAAIAEATTDFVGVADRVGRVLSINRAGREMVGVGEDEDLSGTTIADYHPAWVCDVVLGEGIPTALREGSWSGETELLARDGRKIPVSQVIVAHRAPDGEVRFLSTTARDITERKRVEGDLAESRQMFEGIAEATPDLLYVSEFDGGRNVYANRQAEKILGYTREELAALGGTINETLVHPEDVARALSNWAAIAELEDGEVQEHEFRARHADGSYRWLRARNVVLSRGEDGGVRRVLGLAQDVTGDKQAEEERRRLLEAAERRAAELDAVIRNMPDAVYIGDASGISVCNDAALEMLGFGSVAELNQNVPILSERLQNRFVKTGERISPEEEPFARALAGETAVEEVIARHLKTGRDVIVRSAAAPILRDGKVVAAVAVNTDITEQKEAQERLAYHASLLENMHDAVVATDERFVVKAWNRGAEEMFGRTAEEVLGRDAASVVDADFTGERRAEAVREIAEKGRSRQELLVYHKDGTPVHVEAVSVAIRDGRGRTSGYLTIYRDVTERKEAEEALRESNARIEEILESVTDAFYAVDAEWRFTYLNERAVRFASQLAGEELTRERLLGKTLWETLPAVVGTPLEEHYRRALRERETAVFEYPYPGGGPVFEVHAYPSDGGLSVYFQEITERKEAEEALRDSEERFRALAAATFEGIAVHEEGVMLETNDALAHLFGYEPPEVIGRSALELAAPESRDLIRRNIASGYEEPYEAVGLRKDGSRFRVELRGRPFEYRGRVVRATAIRDITERKRVEEALAESRKAERRRMARDLHDVVLQDLAAAVQAVQAAQQEARAPVDALKYAADALRRATRGLRDAVHDLRLEEGKRPFVRAVESLVELNRHLTPEREVTLEVREGFPPELPERVGAELLRVMREALANARRHSDARRVAVTLWAEADGIGVDVSDEGRGFDPTAEGRGGGVGLVAMEERARSLGGEFEVRSAVGEGTRVRVKVKRP